MNIELHIYAAKLHLDKANEEIANQNYDTALSMLACSYSNVREVMEHTFRKKREAALASNSAGENTQ